MNSDPLLNLSEKCEYSGSDNEKAYTKLQNITTQEIFNM